MSVRQQLSFAAPRLKDFIICWQDGIEKGRALAVQHSADAPGHSHAPEIPPNLLASSGNLSVWGAGPTLHGPRD